MTATGRPHPEVSTKMARLPTDVLPKPGQMLPSPTHTTASIGWEHLIYRWFVKTWCTLQDEHVQNSKKKHVKTTGERWLIGLIKIIWNHVLENWESCNEERHGRDATTQEAAKYMIAQQESMALYEHHHKVGPCDQDLFYTSMDEHFTKKPTLQGLQQWLNTRKPIILQRIQERKHTRTYQMQDIQTFFQTNPN